MKPLMGGGSCASRRGIPGRRLYGDNIGIMENNVETTTIYWGYIGIMEEKMETTIMGLGFMQDRAERPTLSLIKPHFSGVYSGGSWAFLCLRGCR